ncbi:Serine-aspartate repeat-containing protein D precursor [Metalysinibacillus saudimassiliensis]|uniref:Serine-aspartate repeat-containing protein D n=1 Tax=Metalysinibacillus saudimassiliensis TaxID=1461583 RepID=A0A078M8G5_9BACL|nr:Serine-aspartate repeat-containing protein D precursor [Metalysinibacillus saudimassiliensis]
MKQRIVVFAMMILLVGQTVLGPLATISAYADDSGVTVTDTVDAVTEGSTVPSEVENPSTETPVTPATPETETNGGGNPEQPQAPPSNEGSEEITPTPGDVNGENTGTNTEAKPEDEQVKEETPKDPQAPDEEGTEEDKEGEDTEEVDKPIAPGDKTGFHLILHKATKGPNEEPFTEENPLDPMDAFFMHYKWNLDDGHGYVAGDTVSFKLPKELNVVESATGNLAGASTNFATYHVALDGTVTFTFTEAVTEMSAITGDFFIQSTLDASQSEIDDGKVIIGPMEEGGTIEIPVNTGNMKANISKSNQPLPAFSPKEVQWTITVDSEMMKHKDGKVTDVLPAGLTYKPGTLQINGAAAADPVVSGQNLEIALGDFKGVKTITLITTIDESKWDEKNFTNTASYEATDVEKITASSTVYINRGEPLKKKPGKYNPVTQEMQWEIELNFDGRKLTNTTIEDSWENEIMQLVDGSFEFYEVSINDNGHATVGSKVDLPHTVNSSTTAGFNVDIPNIDKPYVVKYKTKLTDRLITGQTIANNVKWNGKTSQGNVWAEQGVGYKGHSSVNYNKKTVEWYLVANTDEKQMNNFVIHDELGPGLTLKEDTIVVRVGGKNLVKGTDYVLVPSATGFELKFIGAYASLTDTVEVRYTTAFDYTKLPEGQNFTNKAKYTWYTDGKDTPWEKEVTDGFTPDDYTKNDGTKSGKYNATTKTISWTIGVNYQQNNHTDLIVKDLIQGDQKLLPDTIKVHEGVLNGNQNSITPGVEITNANVTKPTVDGQPGFQVNFGETDKAYVITYETSLADLDYIGESYNNTANVFDGSKKLTDLLASVGITNGGQYGSKTGNQNGSAIDWSVVVNASQSLIENAMLTDTLSVNQEFLQDSVKVYTTTVDRYGKIEKGAPYENVTISVTKEAPQTLTVKFNDDIDRPYIVEYSTLYFAAHGEKVSNGYKITGQNIHKDGSSGGNETVTIKQTTGGSASGKVGYLTLHKVASDDKNKVFEGVEFQLIDPKTNKVLKTAVTDAQGTIDFGRLMFGEYLVKETKAPAGYITPTTAYKVTINKEYIKGDTEKIGNIETIVNDKEIKQIEIGKYEPGASWLAGAEFMIKNDKGEVVEENLVTDANGKVTSKELPVGTYTLVETKAPKGYNKLTEPIEFTIEAGKAEPVVRDVANVKLGDVLLEKKDKATGKVLAGVEFELQKKNAETGKFEKIGATLTTDEHGVITVKDLENGEYQFVETKPLEGYKPLKDPIAFTVAQKTRAALNFVVENEMDESSQKVIKVDADDETKRLAGAQFELYAEKDGERTLIPNGDKTYFTTDANGEIEFANLMDGQYVFVEIKAPVGYELSVAEYRFVVGDGKAEPITVTNKMKLVNIELFKRDVVDGKGLQGSEFSLTNQDGSVKFENLDTNAEGKLTIENVPEGQYTLTETKRPDGYQTLPNPIVIEVKQNSPAIIEVDVPNAPLGHAQIMKVETGTINPIAGVTFKLEKYFNDAWREVERVTTDENGFAFSEKLDFGTYRYVEVEAPTGVVIESTPVEFEVDQENYDKADLSFTAENSYSQPKVELQKVDANGTALAGAQFELHKLERTGEDTLIKNGDATFFTTNDKGMIEVELDTAGDYYFIEIKAPAGYKLDRTKLHVTVNKGEVAKVEMKNTKLPPIVVKGSVELIKVDAKDGKVLAGAEFKLVDKAGNTVKDNLVTDAAGKIKVSGLDEGDYYFIETKAPVGYELNEGKYLVQVHNSTTARVVVENKISPVGPPEPGKDKGEVELTKVDAKDATKVLAGAEFKLVDKDGKTVEANLVTDKTGKVTVKDLDEGDYYFIETKAPNGYELDTTKHLVQVKKATTAKIVIENKAKTTPPGPGPSEETGEVELTKVDAADSAKVLAGAEFKLVDKDGKTVEANLVTDKTGKVTVKDLDEGDYYFIETKAPKDYKLDTTKHLVTVKGDTTAKIVVENNKKPTGGGGGDSKEASLKLIKVDGDTQKVLPGAVFEFYKVAAGSDEKIGTYTTNQNGEINLKDLDPGSYYFVEIKAPAGYTLVSEKIKVDLVRGSTELITVENKKSPGPGPGPEPEDKTGSIKLVKIDDETQLLLPHAEFDLYQVTTKGDKKVGSYTTNSFGEIVVKDLAFGEYYFVETKAPTGYELSKEKIKVEVNKESTTLVTVENTKTTNPGPDPDPDPKPEPGEDKGAIKLIKVDGKTQQLLPNAEFDLYQVTAKGDKKIGSYTTNSAGEIVVTDLAFGEYYFVETKAPTDYVLITDKIKVEVNHDSTKLITVENNKSTTPTPNPDPNEGGNKPNPDPNPSKPVPPVKPEKPGKPTEGGKENPKLPQTDGTNQTPFIIVGALLIALGVVLAIRRRKAL